MVTLCAGRRPSLGCSCGTVSPVPSLPAIYPARGAVVCMGAAVLLKYLFARSGRSEGRHTYSATPLSCRGRWWKTSSTHARVRTHATSTRDLASFASSDKAFARSAGGGRIPEFGTRLLTPRLSLIVCLAPSLLQVGLSRRRLCQDVCCQAGLQRGRPAQVPLGRLLFCAQD